MSDKASFLLRIIMTIVNSLLVILVFNKVGLGDNAVLDRKGCVFFIASSVVQTNLQTNLMLFTHEKPKFYKELEKSMYGVMPYFLSKTIMEIPIQMLLSIIVFTTSYFLAGLNSNDPSNYFIFMLIIFLTGYTGGSFGIFMLSLFDNKEILPAIFPFLILPQLMSAGYYSSIKNIPYVFYFFKYISVYRYAYQALSWNEFEGLSPESLECNIPAKCVFPTINFPEDLDMCLIILSILAFAMNLLAASALKIRVNLRKS